MNKKSNRRRILVFGFFGYVTKHVDGQSAKVRNVYSLISSHCTNQEIDYFDTQALKFDWLAIFKMFAKIFRCDMLVYLPGKNNLTYLFPVIFLLKRFIGVKVLYFVVGAWLYEYLRIKPILKKMLLRIEGIFVETNFLVTKLSEDLNFCNVKWFPNFRFHNYTPYLKEPESIMKIVFMARVTKLKGIDAVFNLSDYLENKSYKAIIHIYGLIDTNFSDYFKKNIYKHKLIEYKGVADPKNVHTVLNDYDVLVLPTQFKTEGFPGTILDAYISGTPVVVSNTSSLYEFVDEGKTGYIYDLTDENQFYEHIDRLCKNKNLLLDMRKNALNKSYEYSSECAWKIIEKIV